MDQGQDCLHCFIILTWIRVLWDLTLPAEIQCQLQCRFLLHCQELQLHYLYTSCFFFLRHTTTLIHNLLYLSITSTRYLSKFACSSPNLLFGAQVVHTTEKFSRSPV